MRVGKKRGTAALTAALLVTVVAAPGAAAQQENQEPTSMATPPPLEPGWPVPRGIAPDTNYEIKTQCISSLDKGVDLKNKPWGQQQLRFDELHKFSTGKDVLVGVIDTGVKAHPFFQDRIKGGGDLVKGGDGLEDCDGHGTEVAGIIAAKPPVEKGIGFKGIAPDARILSIRQSSTNYQGRRAGEQQDHGAGSIDSLAQAVVHATDQGVRVLNMSVDSCRPVSQGGIKQAEKNLQAALRYAFEKDVVLVASAGNSGENLCPDARNGDDPNNPTHLVTPPWFSEYVLSVAATDRNGDPAKFSVQGPWVSVAAPGTEIISLDPALGSDGLANLQVLKDGKTAPIQGTSFAAPYVAGLAALIRDRHKHLTAKQVMDRIKITASHPAAPGGRDNLVGHGVINPIGALTATIPSEHGIAADSKLDMKLDLPPAVETNWLPMRVAVIGSSAGVVALLLTLFIVRTVRRNNGDTAEPRGSA
ncbi:membrane-anchored mycosin MYCP [Actinokineospora alba]|uniref:Membrane-anchored mycosin MYCP n=1 Tax=Actinokineospora alba TaxID=504798 RepID=A0A1H0V6L5_9PSEU|nr:type VII secretion-associated serine protease mycosin [Actinokineospora alba]TDP65487.1 membrane-anchored mycosin MYCP [Actinokineospora alba]SDH63683.1 membrane-anchored mycosin MYCP [Actinokineospora alba]SDP73905.1 membrane-anchored mycosin MYCP [Actinokineospora alba]